ncbi:MAG: hypothetical protein R3C10_12460 [Pirellulales bacterium]
MKKGCFVASRCLITTAAVTLLTGSAAAQQTRVYEKDGHTYREDHRIVRTPVSEIQYERHPETVYREVVSPRVETNYQTVYLPVTEYRLEAKWVGRWNPFVQPHMVSQWKPRTHWQPHVASTPTVHYDRQWVAETREREVPVLVQRMEETTVVATTAIPNLSGGNSTGSTSTPLVARHETIGSLGMVPDRGPVQSVMSTSNTLPLLR